MEKMQKFTVKRTGSRGLSGGGPIEGESRLWLERKKCVGQT